MVNINLSEFKKENIRRNKKIEIRFSQRELKELLSKQKRAGVNSTSEFIRILVRCVEVEEK